MRKEKLGVALELESVPMAEMERLQRSAYIRFFLRPTKILNLFRVVSAKMLILMALHAIRGKKP